MMNKVLLILADGMRPDAIDRCGNPYAATLMKESAYTPAARTVFPSVTLPCHMSLFLSVEPGRHNTLTNTYVPQVRPINGLCETLRLYKKRSAFFYSWEQLRDLTRPDSLELSYYANGHIFGYEKANPMVTTAAINHIRESAPDFVFLYLGYPDAAGHGFGWMGKEYLESVRESIERMEQIITTLPAEYNVIVTADHGGHERMHGTELAEDMTIPLFLRGERFSPGADIPNASILDIAPTIAELIGVPRDEDWCGKSLV